jgi:hypothetical protein
MIDKVSDELLQEWEQIGLQKGLTTTPVDPAAVKTIVLGVYEHILREPAPEEIIIRPSPIAAWNYVADRECLPAGQREIIWPALDGHWSAQYYAGVGCYRKLGVTDIDTPAIKAGEATQCLDAIYPMPGYCVVSDTPRIMRRKGDQLHCDTGPAVQYSDGWSTYVLNGVRVDKVIVETPLKDIDAAWLKRYFVDEVNVDVKREVLRRVGVERVVAHLKGQVLDKMSLWLDAEHNVYEEAGPGLREIPYELLELDFGGGAKSRALKMLNASIDAWHVEAVDPACKTVREALAFRNGTSELPKKLA